MELHSTCGSNSLRQLPILDLLIYTRQKESFYGWMVATDPSEDAELPTTRLRMTSVPCLGLILRCPSFFLHVHSLLWFMFLFTDNHHPYTLIWLHLWCGLLPLCWSRLFPIVLWCITNLLLPWHHTPFVLTYSSFTWSRVLLIDHSHPPSCLCFPYRPDYSEFWLIPIVQWSRFLTS